MKSLQLLLFCVLTASTSFSQCDTSRYRSSIFSDVYKLEDVKYGEAPVWNFPYNNTDLYLDIYEPLNDPQTKRPLMIWIHPGGFLLGDKSADDITALCDSFARKGYVTVSLGYRLGFNPLSNSSAQRAVYRSVQDVRAAIRYLYEFADVYDIDTNYTFVGGSSAGAVTSLHLAYLDQNEAPNSIQGGLFDPDLGGLDDTGNSYSHNINLTGIVGLWGALGDSMWINTDETTPAMLIHGTDDGVVSFGVGSPFGAPTLDPLHGSRSIHNRLDDLSIPHSFHPFDGLDHEFHGADNGTFNSPPNAYWDTILHLVDSHYLSLLLPETPSIIGNSALCAYDTAVYSLTLDSLETGCWEVNNGTVLANWGDSIEVVWEQSGNQTINAHAVNSIGAYSSKTTLDVTVFELPPVIDFTVTINGNEVLLTPDSTGYSYNWDFGDGNQSTQTSPVHYYGSTGVYEITSQATDQNGCSSVNSELIYVEVLDLASLTPNGYRVFPTVTSGLITVEGISKKTEYSIYENSGRIVSTGFLMANESMLNLSGLGAGSYYLRIQGTSKPFRIIVEK